MNCTNRGLTIEELMKAKKALEKANVPMAYVQTPIMTAIDIFGTF